MLSENNVLKSILRKIKEKGELNEELIEELRTIFPDKIEKTIEILSKGIIQYTFFPSGRKVWVAIGSKNIHHLIYPNIYCDCFDFYKNVVIKKKSDLCKHILAHRIALSLNDYEEISFNDDEFAKFIEQFKFES